MHRWQRGEEDENEDDRIRRGFQCRTEIEGPRIENTVGSHAVLRSTGTFAHSSMRRYHETQDCMAENFDRGGKLTPMLPDDRRISRDVVRYSVASPSLTREAFRNIQRALKVA